MKGKATAFWDDSALVPLCVHESATSAAVTHLKEFSPVVWWGSIIEIQSAICRLNRERTITDAGKKSAIARLETLSRAWREISAGDKLRELALDLLSSYPLKAADSLQLAASLIWCDENPARRNFVCADQRLSKIARSIGFGVLELS
ncbi:MAG TPA: type II toxin-antitoxin system VapC family toxin [Candidatus Acidoferrales bacterium]|nr:type II toxin-antitoxin system VapC family toxin [Candidatus Acidoferrales bacterium]